jgi:hypothetical protein
MTTSHASMVAQALDGAHPACWPHYSAPLIAQARRSAIGRRMLAIELAQSRAPTLMGNVAHVSLSTSDRWALFDVQTMEQWTFDLGALLFAPLMRLIVARRPLQDLKKAIGEERYSAALSVDHAHFDANWVSAGRAMLDEALKVPGALVSMLHTEGAQELLNQVAQIDAALSERVRLNYPWLPAAGKPRIARDVVSARLSALYVNA